MTKKINIILITLFFIIFIFNFVGAVNENYLKEKINTSVAVSEKNVRYDKKILDKNSSREVSGNIFCLKCYNEQNRKTILKNVFK